MLTTTVPTDTEPASPSALIRLQSTHKRIVIPRKNMRRINSNDGFELSRIVQMTKDYSRRKPLSCQIPRSNDASFYANVNLVRDAVNATTLLTMNYVAKIGGFKQAIR